MNTSKPKASHVNTGTSVSRDQLAQPKTKGPVVRLTKTHVECKSDSKVTGFGGLLLVVAFLRKFAVADVINKNVSVLKQHQPYYESDHILAQAMSLYVGGTCLEDMSALQHNEAVLRMVGACRLPDPTTAGDFLRRFDPEKAPGSLEGLRRANDELQCKVWKAQAHVRSPQKWSKKNKGKMKKRALGVVDLDGHFKETYGDQKEGADFSHKGKWGFHPLLISMDGTGDCLGVRNRSGNLRSSNGAAEALDETLQYARPYFKKMLIRGDSDFDRSDLRKVCHDHKVNFAFVGREFKDRPGIATSIPEHDWQPFRTRAHRSAEQQQRKPGYKKRAKKPNRRRECVRKRGYTTKQMVCQWVAEVPWRPPKSDKTYRLVIRRQKIETHEGQTLMFDEFRYRYIVTDLPASTSADEVVDQTYERCDQENVIEQMDSGLPAWRMPVAEFAGNCAWLEIARLAWNLRTWIAQLALPDEVVRWEWKRFRRAFVFIGVEVIKRSRQIWLRFSGSHRFLDELLSAHQCLDTS